VYGEEKEKGEEEAKGGNGKYTTRRHFARTIVSFSLVFVFIGLFLHKIDYHVRLDIFPFTDHLIKLKMVS